jgi:hypothetical protein
MFCQSCLLHLLLLIFLLARFKQEQAIVQEELFQVVKREREAALKHLKTSVLPEGVSTGHEKQQSAQLVSASLPQLVCLSAV